MGEKNEGKENFFYFTFPFIFFLLDCCLDECDLMFKKMAIRRWKSGGKKKKKINEIHSYVGGGEGTIKKNCSLANPRKQKGGEKKGHTITK